MAPAVGPGPVSDDAWGGAMRIHFLNGTAAWRGEPAPTNWSNMASQVVFGYCRFVDGTPSSDQFHLSDEFPHGTVPNGTAAFELTADWTDEDYRGSSLRFLVI